MSHEINEQGVGAQGAVPEAEVEARAQGWRPKNEFSGPEDSWVDAETFNRRGREILPIVQSQNRKLRDQVARLQADHAATRKTMEEFAQYHATTAQREYHRAMETLKHQRHAAMENGDLTEAVRLERQMEVVANQAQTAVQHTPRVHEPDHTDVGSGMSDLEDWTSSKPWFATDQFRTGLAVTLANQLRDSRPDLQGNGPAFLAELDKQLVVQFPQHFGPPANRMEGPSSAGAAPAGRGRKRTVSDLPLEARRAMDKFVKDGLLTEQQYLAEYDWS